MIAGAAEARLALRREMKCLALAALESGVEATRAADAVTQALPSLLCEPPFADAALIDVLAWGKAAVPMARAALALLGSRCGGGLIVCKVLPAEADEDSGAEPPVHGRAHAPLRLRLAGHPLPDARSAAAGEEALALARDGSRDRPMLVLGSGGGSSLLACPISGVEVSDLAQLLSELLRSGGSIHEMNVVRKHLSRVHGGRLAEALGERSSVTLLISDVTGDDPADVGSGPAAADLSTFGEALEILDRLLDRGLVPVAVRAALEEGARGERPETPGPGDLPWEQHRSIILRRNADALAAAEFTLMNAGWLVLRDDSLDALAESPAADELGVRLIERALALAAAHRSEGGGSALRVALLSGGEAAVRVTGQGPGGRNQHLAAVAAREIDAATTRGLLGSFEIVAAALASDAEDGQPEVAGAIVDASTWSRAIERGLSPGRLLAECASGTILASAEALLPGSPPITNVMDLRVVLVASVASSAAEFKEVRT